MDIRAQKDAASQLMARGKFGKAVEVLWRLIEADGADPQLRLKHGEACRRAGMNGRAVASYRVAAELFSQAGHHARALAAVRLALEVAPGDPALERARQQLTEQRRSAAPSPPSPPPHPAFSRHRAISLESIELTAAEILHDEQPAPPEPSSAPEVRRLSACALAFRPAPGERWVVLRSSSPIDVRFVEELEEAEGAAEPTPLRRTFTGELLSEEEFLRSYA